MASRPKVLHVCTIGMTAVKLLRPQAEYLRNQGYDVGFVFSPDAKARMELENAGFGVEEIFISRSISPLDVVSILRMAAYFKKVRPDIVHTHTSKAGIVGRVAARLAGVPQVIHTVHGFPFAEGQNRVKYALYAAVEWWAARLTDVLLSQSLEDVETAKRLGIRAREGYPVHIGNGIDLRCFDHARFAGQRDQIRRELGLGEEPVITTVARLNFEKGYRELVDALAQITSLKWTALFVGEDEGAGPWIRQTVAQLGLQDRVRLLGPRPDVERILAVTDLFVLASYREGMPRSTIEAQAMGVPVIATDIRGCREVVQDGVTGVLVPARDTERLAEAITSMLRDRNLAQLGQMARRHAQHDFDERTVCPKILHSYPVGLKTRNRQI